MLTPDAAEAEAAAAEAPAPSFCSTPSCIGCSLDEAGWAGEGALPAAEAAEADMLCERGDEFLIVTLLKPFCCLPRTLPAYFCSYP